LAVLVAVTHQARGIASRSAWSRVGPYGSRRRDTYIRTPGSHKRRMPPSGTGPDQWTIRVTDSPGATTGRAIDGPSTVSSPFGPLCVPRSWHVPVPDRSPLFCSRASTHRSCPHER
jgi:hypothetical protein